MGMILKNKMGKGAASTIIMLAVGLMVLLGLSALLFKGTSSADPLSVLQCIIAGGKDCQAEKGAEENIKKDLTASIRDAVRCAYLVCFDKDKFYCGNKRLLEGLSWGSTDCFKHFCKATTKPKICGEDSQRNPIIISQALEKPEFIPVLPLDDPLNEMRFVGKNKKCEPDVSRTTITVDERLLVNEDGRKDCDEDKGASGEGKGVFGKQTKCRLKSDKEIYVFHEKGDHVILCSEKPLFATKPSEGKPKGPVTLFEDEQSKNSGGAFFDISQNTPNIENVKGWNKPTSVKLAPNYGVILYDDKDYKGGCRTFFDSSNDLRKFGFSDKTGSVKIFPNSFKGAILYEKPFKHDGTPDQNADNEFYPNVGKIVYLKDTDKDTDCVHQKAQSIEVSTDSIAVLYEDTKLLLVTDRNVNLPEFARKATHIKVCKKDTAIPLEKNTCLEDNEKFSLNKDLPSARPPESITLKPNACADGTEFGKCSKGKPTFCDNGNLITKASVCGCPDGAEILGENCVGIKSFTCTVDLDCELPIVETSIGYVKLYDTRDRLIARYPCENNKCTLSGNFMKPVGTTYKIVVEWYGDYAEKSITIIG